MRTVKMVRRCLRPLAILLLTLPLMAQGQVRILQTTEAGDRVHIIPNHICVAVNLHEQMYGIRGDQVEEIWKVEGRGKLQ